MAENITLPAEVARDLRESNVGDTLGDWTVIAHQRGPDSRWAANYQLVIRGKKWQLYAADYQVALGESNVPDSWESSAEVRFEPVAAVARALVSYVPKDKATPDTVSIHGVTYEVGEWDHRGENDAGDTLFHLYAVPASK
ncbi:MULTISPECIES: hypothetical protein [Streptosporangiaceae]|uniref:hypothetical protein n=1 Tax=Streptosporangiaceae TaxID=2004 RepID=UPI0034010AA5